jgi:peptidoglycan/xylan/chitin deacetylase (PgdA/CDA1 family)
MSNCNVEICQFLNDAPFAYSATYDEGTVDCLANAYPVHEAFGFPGHVNVVAGQLGRKRNCFASSLNDYFHMSVDELRFLLEKGWGVGNHSWSHFVYPTQPGLDMYRELVWSRYTLEDQLDWPVRIFALCNDAYNYDPMIEMVKEHHIACIANHFLAPNREGFDVYQIGNFRMSSAPFPPRPSWPIDLLTENLSLEFVKGAWLLDTTHLAMWNVPQAHKCVTPEDIGKRFSRLTEISNGHVWAAKPDDVVDYQLMRRNLSIENVKKEENIVQFDVAGDWPVGVVNSYLTLRVSGSDFKGTPEIDQEYHKREGGYSRHSEIRGIVQDGDDWLITMEIAPHRTVRLSV